MWINLHKHTKFIRQVFFSEMHILLFSCIFNYILFSMCVLKTV